MFPRGTEKSYPVASVHRSKTHQKLTIHLLSLSATPGVKNFRKLICHLTNIRDKNDKKLLKSKYTEIKTEGMPFWAHSPKGIVKEEKQT